MTVGRLLRETTSRELSEWQAFYRLEHEDNVREQLAADVRSKQEARRRG